MQLESPFAEQYLQLGVYDEDDNRLFKNTDSNGRFHSDWCSMIYSRLLLARTLLADDGVIFISIDDNEQDNLKKICDEVFGEHITEIAKRQPLRAVFRDASFRDSPAKINAGEIFKFYASDLTRVKVI